MSMGPATLNLGSTYAKLSLVHPFLITQARNPGFNSMTRPLFELDNLRIEKS